MTKRHRTETDIEEKEKKARQKDMPLLQLMCLWQDKLGEELNYPIARVQTLLKLKETVDIDRFHQAVDQVYRHHPILLTRLVKTEAGNFVQRYDPELFAPTEAEEVTEEEMWTRVQEGCCTFDLEKGLLHHRHIFKTEKGIYFYMLFHHVLMDGTGLQLIRDNIFRAYHGESLPPDYYYYLLEQEFYEDREDVLKEYEDKYGIEDCNGLLEPDLPGPDAYPHVLTETFPMADEKQSHHAPSSALAHPCASHVNSLIYLYQKDIFSLGRIADLADEVPIPADRSRPMGVLLLTLVDTEGEEISHDSSSIQEAFTRRRRLMPLSDT